jgi:hypothetical protein
MSTLKVDTILKRTGTGTITLGQSGDTIALGSGASQTGFGGDNKPSFGAYLNANQSISNNTNTKINFNTEYWDSDGKFDTSNNRFTPTIAGKYLFNSSLRYDNGAAYEVSLIIYKNGSEYIKVRFKQNTSVETIQVTGILELDTDDYVEIYGRQAQGGSVDVNGDTNGTDSVTARFFGYKLNGV